MLTVAQHRSNNSSSRKQTHRLVSARTKRNIPSHKSRINQSCVRQWFPACGSNRSIRLLPGFFFERAHRMFVPLSGGRIPCVATRRAIGLSSCAVAQCTGAPWVVWSAAGRRKVVTSGLCNASAVQRCSAYLVFPLGPLDAWRLDRTFVRILMSLFIGVPSCVQCPCWISSRGLVSETAWLSSLIFSVLMFSADVCLTFLLFFLCCISWSLTMYETPLFLSLGLIHFTSVSARWRLYRRLVTD